MGQQLVTNRKKTTGQKLILNTSSSLVFEAVTIICGLILPRLIIGVYGSEVNGLVNSIAQFLHVVSFLDLGVGAVVQSALYKPLATHDENAVSQIVVSAKGFFNKIAVLLLAYVAVLIVTYPFITKQEFGWAYSAALVAAMSISYFAQYYFGVVDRLLLTANQEGYVQYTAQIVTLVLNTLACVVAIKLGASIQLVKLITSLIFLLRPIYLRWYVNRHYRINRKIELNGEPIRQKWNGVMQHLSYVVLTSTDNIVLTLFSTLTNVSIYSVYHMVIYGIKQLFISMTNGIKAIIGELWAKNELEKLTSIFATTEWAIHSAVVIVFCCTWKLILPFVALYTSHVTDAEYIQPLFATVIILAHAIHCMRIPYNMLILATGAYKEAQNMHIITALINVVVSVAVVNMYGLVGVAVGTLVAMIYQTCWMILFDSKNNIRWPLRRVGKQLIFDLFAIALIVFATAWIRTDVSDYFDWIILGFETAIISTAVVTVLSFLFYRKQLSELKMILKK